MLARQTHLFALVTGIPEPRRSAKVLVMLQALIDESDSQNVLPRTFIMGGYIASLRQWERLTDEWHSELGRAPKLGYFSFREAFPTSGAPRGEFFGCAFQISARLWLVTLRRRSGLVLMFGSIKAPIGRTQK
jgi:hypothetical protein